MNIRLAQVAALRTRLGGQVSLGVPGAERLPSSPTGLPGFDRRFGGFPRGRVSDLVGPGSSGKLSLLLACLRQGMQETPGPGGPGTVALVDASGTVFPGQEWARDLLVARPKDADQALHALDLLVGSAAFGVVALEASGALPRGLPDALAVRLVRLARETGTTVLCCADRPLFGSHAALRVETRLAAAAIRLEVRKNRQGALGGVEVGHASWAFPDAGPDPGSAPRPRPLEAA